HRYRQAVALNPFANGGETDVEGDACRTPLLGRVMHGEAPAGLGPHVELELTDPALQLALEWRQRRLVAVVGAAYLHVAHADHAVPRERIVAVGLAGTRRHD